MRGEEETRKWRAWWWALVAAVLAAGAATLEPVQAQGSNTLGKCEICRMDRYPGETAPHSLRMSYWACRSARVLSCDIPGEPCWFTGILESIMDTARATARSLPVQMTVPSILAVVAASVVLTLTIDAGRMMLAEGSLGRSAIPARTLRVMVAMAITSAAAGGWGDDLMAWVGHGEAAGGLVGRALGEAIEADKECFNLETGASLMGWEGARNAIAISMRQATELASVLLGVAWTLLPNIADILEAYGKTVGGVLDGDFSAAFEVLRTVFAVTLVGTGLTLVLTVAFQVLESVLVLGITVGLTPVWAWLWVWEGSRRAAHQALAAALYAIASLIFLGVTVQVARYAMQYATMQFSEAMVNKEYKDTGALAAAYADCGVSATPTNLREAYQRFICLSLAKPHKRTKTGTVMWIIPIKRTRDVHASKLEDEVVSWLPHLLLLVGGAVVVTAIMRFGNAAASEITGFRASQNQVAQQALGATKGLLGGASRKLGSIGAGR